jgi:pimeloyl-ACP methyl ester carboxylesterase
MPAVFVHGVPDTGRMWGPLVAELARDDVEVLELPGFGNAPPAGWTATKEAYAGWLEDRLAAFGEPVDLVAHDWGALLAQRVASLRPDLIRTLACGSGPCDEEYTWHAMAQAWQTPEVGEQIVEGMLALPHSDLVAGLVAGGAAADLAADQAETVDAEMARCILALYRSAVTVGAEWQPEVDAMPARPAVVFHGADDLYVEVVIAERLAARLDGALVVYDDCGHWWGWERAPQVATTLTELWS